MNANDRARTASHLTTPRDLTADADRVATGGLRADIARAGPGVTVVSVAGTVDSATTHVLAAALTGAAAADTCGRIVLELNRVTVLNARGLGVIIAAHEYARRSGGAVVLVVDQVAPAAVSLQFLSAETWPVTYPTLTAALTAPDPGCHPPTPVVAGMDDVEPELRRLGGHELLADARSEADTYAALYFPWNGLGDEPPDRFAARLRVLAARRDRARADACSPNPTQR